MAVVRELAIGLRPHRRTSLTANLDRSLGFDSLGRTGLLLRLERAFRVRLPHVSSHGEREQILLWRLGTQEQVITYSELDRVPRGVAGGLLARGSDFDAGLRLRNAARALILARFGEPDLVREQVRPPS